MRNFLARSTIAVLFALQVVNPSFVFSQDVSQKRSQTSAPKAEPPKTPPQKSFGEWKIADSLTIFDQADSEPSSKREPLIRVALATDVRSAIVSTTGHLMNASDEGSKLIPLDVARVRLEPRLLSPLPPIDNADLYRIQLAGMPAREDAEQKSKEVREAIGEDSQVVYDTETKTWGLLVGARRPQIEAEELRARLDAAGVDATVAPVGGKLASTNSPGPLATQTNSNASSIAKSQIIFVGFGVGAGDSQCAAGSAFHFAVAGSGGLGARGWSTL